MRGIDADVRGPGQQLIPRDLVDLGQPEEARDGDRPLAPLVRPEHGSLELHARTRLDVMERQALLAPDRAQPLPDDCPTHDHTAPLSLSRSAPQRASLARSYHSPLLLSRCVQPSAA